LLARICDSPLLNADELREAGALAEPDKAASPKGKKKA
jgi:hypothetical protein